MGRRTLWGMSSNRDAAHEKQSKVKKPFIPKSRALSGGKWDYQLCLILSILVEPHF